MKSRPFGPCQPVGIRTLLSTLALGALLAL